MPLHVMIELLSEEVAQDAFLRETSDLWIARRRQHLPLDQIEHELTVGAHGTDEVARSSGKKRVAHGRLEMVDEELRPARLRVGGAIDAGEALAVLAQQQGGLRRHVLFRKRHHAAVEA